MKKDMKVILASASPRRKELLRMIFGEFEVMPADIDESIPDKTEPLKAAEYIAVKKSKAVDARDALVIASDTVVIIGEKILGKPKSPDEAFSMLKALSGKKHCVVTGVSLRFNEKCKSFYEKTEVEFFTLTDDEINEYIASGEPFDKAGGYGIQGLGGLLIKGINGDYYNVVGLPVARLKREIEKLLGD